MMTSVVFIAIALALYKKGAILFTKERAAVLRRNFVYDEILESQKLHTIEEDEPFFQSAILGISESKCVQNLTSSSHLKAAADYFTEQVKANEWESLVYVLKNAEIMVYSVESAEDATRLFDLQNNRGKVV